MTLTLDFQGHILKKSYLRNGMADWHGTKGMWVDRMLDTCCDFQHSPHPWPWPWIFKVKFKKKSYLRNGMADWHGMKKLWVDMMLDPCCDTQLRPHPWPCPWIFEIKYWNLLYLRNGRDDSLGMKGMWVGYDFGCTIALTLDHSAWQIDWPSNGSMWNSYSFQPVGPWMGYSFTDRGWGVLSLAERLVRLECYPCPILWGWLSLYCMCCKYDGIVKSY